MDINPAKEASVNTQELKKAGVRFSYSANAMVPEIPYIQDVLYALHLVEFGKRFDFCLGSHPPYVSNVMLAAAAATYGIHDAQERKEYDRIIAQAIVDLCPDEAKCLFNPAYAEAWAALGHEVKLTSREQLLLQCGCPRCRAMLAHEGRSLACED